MRHRRGDILAACSRYGARNVRIFGSVARGQARPDSDVDLLCDLDPDRDLVDLAALRAELTDILGRQVDVSTPRLLKPAVLVAALREAVPL
ncbi:MAG: nucleotidyltransferase family protein [Mycobacteriales bacterium]